MTIKKGPSIIIYDVEKEYKEEELKEDLIKKNLECSSNSELEESKKKKKKNIKFMQKFKTK